MEGGGGQAGWLFLWLFQNPRMRMCTFDTIQYDNSGNKNGFWLYGFVRSLPVFRPSEFKGSSHAHSHANTPDFPPSTTHESIDLGHGTQLPFYGGGGGGGTVGVDCVVKGVVGIMVFYVVVVVVDIFFFLQRKCE